MLLKDTLTPFGMRTSGHENSKKIVSIQTYETKNVSTFKLLWQNVPSFRGQVDGGMVQDGGSFLLAD